MRKKKKEFALIQYFIENLLKKLIKIIKCFYLEITNLKL